jgi:hypothetical protein
MPDLTFTVEGAEVAPFAAAPLLLFKLRIASTVTAAATAARMATASASEAVASITLQCQIQIEAARRRYTAPEQDGLQDAMDPYDHRRADVRR